VAEVIKTNIDVSINTSQAYAELRNLQNQINAFNLTLNKNNKAQATQANAWADSLSQAVNRTKFFTAETVKMSTAAGALDATLRKGSTSMGQFFSAAFNKRGAMAAEVFALASERVRTMQTQFVATTKAANGMQQAIAIRPVAAFSDAAAVAAQRTQILSNMFRQGTTQIINFGKNVQWAGRQLMVGFTVPLTIFGVTATKVFRELETEIVNFRKVYGNLFTTDLEVEENLEAVRDLSKEFTKYGIAAKNTMQLAAIAAQSGKEGAELQAATIQATRLATLGEIDKQEAMRATIALQSAFRLSNDELANSINFLNVVENSSVVSLQNLVEAIPRVAPVIVGLGGDVKDMAVFLAAMQEGGVNAAEAANGLKSSLGRLISPTKQAKDMADSFGISLKNIVEENEGNVLGMVIELSKSMSVLSDLQKQQLLSAVFGKFQFARMGALFENITREGSQASRIIEMMDMSIEDMASTAEKELGAIEESVGTKLTGAIERLKLEIAPIGELFAKIAIPLIGLVTKAAEWFNQLSDSRKTIVAWTTLIVAGVVPALTMMFGLFSNLIGQIGRMGQVLTIFGANLITKGPIAALQSLTQSTKYLSLAEIDAANAAQQLGSATNIANQALQETAISASSARIAIDQLTQSYILYNQQQMSAAAVQKPAFGIGSVASTMAGSKAAATSKAAPSGIKWIRRNSGGPIFTLNDGNMVPGAGNSDTVPALLTPGEFVINKESTKNNYGLLEAINNGQKFNSGGMVKNGILNAFGGTLIRNMFGSIANLFKRRSATSNIKITASEADEMLGVSQASQRIGSQVGARRGAGTKSESTQVYEALEGSSFIERLGAFTGVLPGKINNRLRRRGGKVSADDLEEYFSLAGGDAFETTKALLAQHRPGTNLDTQRLSNNVVRILSNKKGQKLTDADLTNVIDDAISQTDSSILPIVRELRNLLGRYRVKGSEPGDPNRFANFTNELRERFSAYYGRPVTVIEVPGDRKVYRILDEGGQKLVDVSVGGTRSIPDTRGIIKYDDKFIKNARDLAAANIKRKAGQDPNKNWDWWDDSFHISHMNQGGLAGNNNVVPGVGNADTVPALLTPGEFVVNKKSTKENYQLLSEINNGMNVGGKVQKYFGGGIALGAARMIGLGAASFGGFSLGQSLTGGNMMGGMAGSLIAPAIISQLGPIITGLGVALSSVAGVAIGVALGFVAMKKIADKVAQSGGELVKAMYGSSDRLSEFAKEFKRETVQQMLAAKRAEIASNSIVSEEAKQFSTQFLESKPGKQFTEDINAAERVGGVEERNKAILRQLLRGIITKAITVEEARAIASDIGQKLNDQSIGIKIGAQISSIVGPDGEDIAKNILEIDAIIRPKIDMQEVLNNVDKQWEDLKFWEKLSSVVMKGGVEGGKRSMTADALAQIVQESKAATREQMDFLRLELENGLIEYEEFEKQKMALFEKSSNAYTDGIKTINRTFGEGTQEAIQAIKDFRKEFEKEFKIKISILSDEDEEAVNRLRESFTKGFDAETIVEELQKRTEGITDRKQFLDELEKIGGKELRRLGTISSEEMPDGSFNIDWQDLISRISISPDLSNRIAEILFGEDTDVAVKERFLAMFDGLEVGLLRVLGNLFDKGALDPNKLLDLFKLDPQIFDTLEQFFTMGGNLENLLDKPNEKILEYKENIDKLASIPSELRVGLDIEKLLMDPKKLEEFIKNAKEIIPILEKLEEAKKEGVVTRVKFESIIAGNELAKQLLKNLLTDQNFKFEDINMEAFLNLTVDPDVAWALGVLNDPSNLDQNQRRRAANILLEKGSAAKAEKGGGVNTKDPSDGDKSALQKALENLKLFREYIKARNKLLEQGLSTKALESLSQEEAIELAKKSGKELKKLIDDFNKATKQVEKLELQKKALEQLSMSPLQEAIRKSQDLVKSYQKEINNLKDALEAASRANELDSRKIEDRRYALQQLSKREDKINESYDERIDALNKVAEANRKVADSESRRIDLATALTSGDISAAAKAAQGMTGAFAQDQIEAARAQLEKRREQELNALTVEMNGQLYTRKQLELEIDEIDERMYQRNLRLREVNDSIYKYERLINDEKNKQDEINEILDKQEENKLNRVVETLKQEKQITKQKREQAKIEAKRAYNAFKTINPNSKESFDAFVGRLGLQLNTGGYINGPGTSTSDSIPAMLSDGEYVIKSDVVSSLGTQFFDMLNGGKISGFKKGGLVKKSPSVSSGMSIRALMQKADKLPTTVKPLSQIKQPLEPFNKKKPPIISRLVQDLKSQIASNASKETTLLGGKGGMRRVETQKIRESQEAINRGVGEFTGASSIKRIATGQKQEGDMLNAALFPLWFIPGGIIAKGISSIVKPVTSTLSKGAGAVRGGIKFNPFSKGSEKEIASRFLNTGLPDKLNTKLVKITESIEDKKEGMKTVLAGFDLHSYLKAGGDVTRGFDDFLKKYPQHAGVNQSYLANLTGQISEGFASTAQKGLKEISDMEDFLKLSPFKQRLASVDNILNPKQIFKQFEIANKITSRMPKLGINLFDKLPNFINRTKRNFMDRILGAKESLDNLFLPIKNNGNIIRVGQITSSQARGGVRSSVGNRIMTPERRSSEVIKGLYQEAQAIAEKSGRNIFTRNPSGEKTFANILGTGSSPDLTISNIFKALSFSSSKLDDLSRAGYDRGMVIFRLLKKEGVIPKNIRSFKQFLRVNTGAFTRASDNVAESVSPSVRAFNEKYLEVYHGFSKSDPLRVWRSSQQAERSKFGYASIDKFMGQTYGQRADNLDGGLRMMGNLLPKELTGIFPFLGGMPGEFATVIAKESASKMKEIGPLIGKALPGFIGSTKDNIFLESKLLTFLNRFYKIDKKNLTPEIIEELSTATGKTGAIEKLIEKLGPEVLIKRFAKGGYVVPQTPPPPLKRALGGIVPGFGSSDSVPSLLTPGEFVIRKPVAQENMGLLTALNSNIFPDIGKNSLTDASPIVQSSTNSVTNMPMYNTYSINVNVPNTNASPEEIANVVMSKMQRLSSSNIRTTRR
jgi:TP901 family phage tail tape measure protein